MRYFQEFLKRRGMVLIVSDFWESPESIIRTIEPLRYPRQRGGLVPRPRP